MFICPKALTRRKLTRKPSGFTNHNSKQNNIYFTLPPNILKIHLHDLIIYNALMLMRYSGTVNLY